MKQNKQIPLSGIRVENTLSMAVQQRNHRRNPLHLVMIALAGAVGSIFTFLSMFQPEYHRPALIGCLAAEFAVCTVMALSPEKWRAFKLGAGLLYLGLLYLFRKPFYSGFICLSNTVYQVIYMTDWERFTVDTQFSRSYCITIFLICICAPILYLLCYAVMHFQNFFLSLIATFPYVEIGFYFGVPANHLFAIMLLAFWFSTASVHLSNAGTYHGKGQSSFLRRENTFFPVSSMRFMVTEKVGISVLVCVMVICFLIQHFLQASGYKRSDDIKVMRSNVQEFLASVMLNGDSGSSELWKGLWVNRKPENDRVVVALGQEAQQEFDHITVSDLTFSDLPEGRLYLKYRTGEVYEENSWCMPEDSVYQVNDVFGLFEQLDYYPQEFLYENMQLGAYETITMTMHDTDETVRQCIPYGFQENAQLEFEHDNRVTVFDDTYEIVAQQDFESVLLGSSQFWMAGSSLNEYCRPEHTALFSQLFDFSSFPGMILTVPENVHSSSSEMTMEASLLSSYGYKEYVMHQHTQVPDTQSMRNVRNAYSSLLGQFSAETASAGETVAFLQELREEICSSMTYTLSPGRTPSNRDFVEFFLLENQKGYCMHYATAGVMLARMAGIPARYCEGFMIDSANNTTLKETEIDGETVYSVEVLDSNAHAWAEFYVDGWGWIPFEFTFTQTEEEQQMVPVPVPPTEPPITIPVTPVTPTSPADITPSETSEVSFEPQQTGNLAVSVLLKPVLYILGVFLLIALLLWMIHFMRVLALRRRSRQFTQKDRNAAARCAYGYLLRLLSYCGVHTKVQRTAAIAEQGMEKCAEYLNGFDLEAAVAVAAKAEYSPHVVTVEELHMLIRTAKHLARGIYQKAKPIEKLKLKYILHLL